MKRDVNTKIKKTFFVLGVLNGVISLFWVIVGIYFYTYIRSLISYSKSPEEFAVNMSIAAIVFVVITLEVVSAINTISCLICYRKSLSDHLCLGFISLFVISCSVITILIFMIIAGYILCYRFIS
jgi:hypothetical protein